MLICAGHAEAQSQSLEAETASHEEPGALNAADEDENHQEGLTLDSWLVIFSGIVAFFTVPHGPAVENTNVTDL